MARARGRLLSPRTPRPAPAPLCAAPSNLLPPPYSRSPPFGAHRYQATGYQVTRDRPFAIAELIMKTSQEQDLRDCLYPSGGCAELMRCAARSAHTH